MRRLVFNHLTISPLARAALDPGVTWFGWHVPALLEAAMIVVIGLVMLGIAIWEFSTTNEPAGIERPDLRDGDRHRDPRDDQEAVLEAALKKTAAALIAPSFRSSA